MVNIELGIDMHFVLDNSFLKQKYILYNEDVYYIRYFDGSRPYETDVIIGEDFLPDEAIRYYLRDHK